MHLAFLSLLAHVYYSGKTSTASFTQASRMLYSSFAKTEKGGGILLFSLFLPLVTFFVFSTIASSIFLLAHFQNCLGALVVYEVERLEGFLTNMLVLLEASTSIVKLRIYKFSK